jgi:hypothetical protein
MTGSLRFLDDMERANMSEIPTRIDKTDARQGKTGLGVRYVLFGSLILIILAGIVIYTFVR